MHLKTLTPERQVSESGYRFLNPELGRWCSRDPIGHLGGPNVYGFVGSRPVDREDNLGRLTYESEDPDKSDCGFADDGISVGCGFKWKIKWKLDEGETDGWIIQKMDVYRQIEDCEANTLTSDSPWWKKSSFIYYEVWPVVDGNIYVYHRGVSGESGFTPNIGPTFLNGTQGEGTDTWKWEAYYGYPSPGGQPGTRGNIFIFGTAHFFAWNNNVLPSNFSSCPAGAPCRNNWATKDDPSNWSVASGTAVSWGSGYSQNVVKRNVHMSWDCCCPDRFNTLFVHPPVNGKPVW